MTVEQYRQKAKKGLEYEQAKKIITQKPACIHECLNHLEYPPIVSTVPKLLTPSLPLAGPSYKPQLQQINFTTCSTACFAPGRFVCHISPACPNCTQCLRLPQEPLPRTQPLPSPTTPKSSDTDPTPSLVPKVCCEVSTRLRMPPFSDTVLRLMIFLQPETGDLRTPLCLRIWVHLASEHSWASSDTIET